MRLPSGQGGRGGRRRRADDAPAARDPYGRDRTRLVGGQQAEYGADRGAPGYEERRGRPPGAPRSGLVGNGGPGNGAPGNGGPGNRGAGYDGPGYQGSGYDGRGYLDPGYPGRGHGPGNGGPGYEGGPHNDPGYNANPGYNARGDGSGYGGPGYEGSGHSGPGYEGRGNEGPDYSAPGYEGPGYYGGPGLDGPGYGGPGLDGPGYGGPGFDGPGYSEPRYEGPGYSVPGYGRPGNGGPDYGGPGYWGDGYEGGGYRGNGGAGRHASRYACPDDLGDAAGSTYGFVGHGPDRRGGQGHPKHRPVRRRRYRRGHGAARLLPAIPAAVIAGVAFVVCAALVMAGVQLSRASGRAPVVAAAAANANCTLIVPENPLSPLGLATPYLLTATNPAQGPCHEADADETAFVQGAIINTNTGQISIYDPLVIDEGTTPAVAPVVPKLPMNSVVALWFGYNGDNLTLAGADQMAGVSPSQPMSTSLSASVTSATSATASTVSSTSAKARPSAAGFEFPASAPTSDFLLQQADCVSGEDINGKFSTFTQVAACNAPAFFAAADAAIKAGTLTVPSPGTAVDGESCLTTRSFALVDQDQSDNVTTEYLTERNGQIAQDTTANRQSLPRASVLFNGSDNGLLDLFIDPSLHCSPWELPNQADNGALTSALPLDELQAAAWAGQQGSGPMALVPLNDPMTVDNHGSFNTGKTDAYRSLVGMAPLPAGEPPTAYCTDIEQIQGTRLQEDVNLLIKGPSPAPDEADNLFTFMAMRLQQSFVNLGCATFGQTNDVSTTMNKAGVVVAACFAQQVAPLTQGTGNPMAGRKKCPATTG
jgi:hypothetical protein